MTNILWAGLIIGSIGLLGGILLCVVSKLCQTNKTNEKLEKIRAALPGANCGSCGFAGCDAYAEAVEQGTAEPGLSSVLPTISLCRGFARRAARKPQRPFRQYWALR